MKQPEPVSQSASPPQTPDPMPDGSADSASRAADQADPIPANEPETGADPVPETSSDLPEVLAKACARHGLGAAAVADVQREVLDAVDAAIKADEASRQSERAALLDELQEHWGAQAQPVLDAAAAAAQRFGLDEDDLEDLLDCGDPRTIIPALARAGQALQALDDDGAGPAAAGEGELPGAGGGMTADAAQAELARLAADRDHRLAFLNRAHPGHAAAKAQRARLVAAAQTGPKPALRGGRALG